MMLAEALTLAAAAAFPACVRPIEAHFRLPTGIVNAVIQVESGGNPRAINAANRNGTTDFGLMQINSFHLPRLAGHGINQATLLDAPCINVAVGADILAQAKRQTGGALAPALSMYNTGRPDSSIGAGYAARVLHAFSRAAGAAAAPAAAFAGLPPISHTLPAGLPAGLMQQIGGLESAALAIPATPVAPVITPERSPLLAASGGFAARGGFTPASFKRSISLGSTQTQ